jgi:hypothetical protein
MVRWFAVNSRSNAVDHRDYFRALASLFQKRFGAANLVNVGCR